MPGVRRLRAVATAGVLAAVTFGIWSGVRPAAAWAGSAPTIGPVQISALGRPRITGLDATGPRITGLDATGPRITGLDATDPRVTGGGAGWSCDVWSLTCTGTLPSGASSRIAIAGRLPADSRPGDFYTVRARASVAETSQRPGTTRTTTSLTVAVHAAAPGAPGSTAPAGRSPLPLTALIAAALLLGGGILLVVTRRTRPPARHSLPR